MDNVYLPNVRMGARDRWLVTAALAICALFLLVGWWSMTRFAYHVEEVPTTNSATWPQASSLPRRSDSSQLVAFIHPLCPCSNATLAELERLLSSKFPADAPPCQVVVVVVTPRHADVTWTGSPLIERFRKLNGAQLVFDAGGVEAERFGAVTSGTILYYDAGGQRRYRGGMTQSRGHEGDNPGKYAIEELLTGHEPTGASIPPFGCRLVSEPQQSPTDSAASAVTRLTK
jgi:hypothetical protein